MIKQGLFSFIFLAVFSINAYAQQAKYVFYMIGDGMGINQVRLAELFHAQSGNNTPMIFSTFPFVGIATTHSQSADVTDSAAAGTALATGKKTKNGTLGMDSTGTIAYNSVAIAAKNKGMKVGITTSVSINHATPAAFYAHQSGRAKGYEIALDIIPSKFDFFGGAGFTKADKNADGTAVTPIHNILEENGYKIAKGFNAYKEISKKSDKTILTNPDNDMAWQLHQAIDRKDGHLALPQITEAAITSLSDNNKKGFFLMVEGAMIDWVGHNNDAAAMLHEVLDFNESVKLAYEFYKKHPNETLIVVTADHETGGLILGNGSDTLNLNLLQAQKVSVVELSKQIVDLKKNNAIKSWEELKQFLSEKTGLWNTIKVSPTDASELFNYYQAYFETPDDLSKENLYNRNNIIAIKAIDIINKAAGIGWASNEHSATPVPIFAIGVGAENFTGFMDNTDIPKKIAKAAGLEIK